MKAITPVIALVMLMLITVGMVGIAFVWFTGIFSSSTNKSVLIPPGGAYCDGGDITVRVLNEGSSVITGTDILVADVDGTSVLGTPFMGDMKNYFIGQWKMDETSGIVAMDTSGNGNDGTLKPSCPDCPQWVDAKYKKGLKFDGSNDYTDITNELSSGITDSMTLGGWVRPNAITNYGVMMRPVNGNFWLQWSSTSNYFYGAVFRSDGSDVRANFPAGVPALDKWTHISMSYEKGVLKIFANGVQVGSDSKPVMNVKTMFGSTRIGGGAGGGSGQLNGLIDEVRLYKRSTGDVNIQPGQSAVVINYPGTEGRHATRIGTSTNVAEASVTCA
ncbi:MAG: LamG domain-containing protein [Candidatus Aenigmarchaeota archaeon]|nr:LamG domain-containing protein [Candidatus Aenigmarchaeota archaeon]